MSLEPGNYSPKRFRFALASSDRLEHYVAADSEESKNIEPVRSMITQNRVLGSMTLDMLAKHQPQLPNFIRNLDALSAGWFRISSIGIAIGHANWRRMRPEVAPEVDIFFA